MTVPFQRYKSNSLHVAFENRIVVRDSAKKVIGSLVPVGSWICDEYDIIDTITSWRSKFNRMFPTRTAVTRQRTRDFIRNSYVENSAAIFFLIYTDENKLIGHLGLSKLDQDCFELVNLVRGVNGGHSDLIYHAEVTLVSLGFELGKFSKCCVELMSYNWIVRDLHIKVGFEPATMFSLMKIINDEGTFHKKVDASQANVNFKIEMMTLTRERLAEQQAVNPV